MSTIDVNAAVLRFPNSTYTKKDILFALPGYLTQLSRVKPDVHFSHTWKVSSEEIILKEELILW